MANQCLVGRTAPDDIFYACLYDNNYPVVSSINVSISPHDYWSMACSNHSTGPIKFKWDWSITTTYRSILGGDAPAVVSARFGSSWLPYKCFQIVPQRLNENNFWNDNGKQKYLQNKLATMFGIAASFGLVLSWNALKFHSGVNNSDRNSPIRGQTTQPWPPEQQSVKHQLLKIKKAICQPFFHWHIPCWFGQIMIETV